MMLKDEPFKADPGHITDFGNRSVVDIFNGVILPTVNSVVELLPADDEDINELGQEIEPSTQFTFDKAFKNPDDTDILASMYRSSQQPA